MQDRPWGLALDALRPHKCKAVRMALASLVAFALVVLTALRFRGRFYAIFAGVILGIHTLSSIAMWRFWGKAEPVFVWLQGAVYLHFFSLIWARMRPRPWRLLVSIPAHYFVGATFLAIPWAVAAGLGFEPVWPFLPYAIGFVGLLESRFARESTVDLPLDGQIIEAPIPKRLRTGASATSERPLTIIQITDPHLGPWMSVARLRRICERAVARQPDLVVLTGDLLTMESNAAPEALAEALAPLAALKGRVFACRGNHDLEAPRTIAYGLEKASVRLLVDEAEVVDTPAGRVQIIGIDYRFRERRAHLAEVCARHPRLPGALRLVLLHDPGAFRHLPEGEGDLVLSGHTHGGQLGLLTLGLSYTALSGFSGLPDHGLWGRGKDRLYVHRGTGHYGFPLRLGVPAEQSLLRVHVRDA